MYNVTCRVGAGYPAQPYSRYNYTGYNNNTFQYWITVIITRLLNLLQLEQTTIQSSVALYAPERERKIRLILNLSSFLNKVVYKIVKKKKHYNTLKNSFHALV